MGRAHDLRTRRWPSAGAILVALLFAAPVSAFAHVPTIEPREATSSELPSQTAGGMNSYPSQNAFVIEGPDESRAIYGYLAPVQPYDAYTFQVTNTVTTTIELIVPTRREAAGFRPSLHLIAPSEGIRLDAQDPGRTPRAEFFEPFSLQSFWKGATLQNVELRPGVEYELVVEAASSSARSGPYVIAFSGAERFTPADWLSSLKVLPTIWLGTYGGAPPRPIAMLVAALLVVTAVALLGRLSSNARRRAAARRG